MLFEFKSFLSVCQCFFASCLYIASHCLIYEVYKSVQMLSYLCFVLDTCALVKMPIINTLGLFERLIETPLEL